MGVGLVEFDFSFFFSFNFLFDAGFNLVPCLICANKSILAESIGGRFAISEGGGGGGGDWFDEEEKVGGGGPGGGGGRSGGGGGLTCESKMKF